MYNRYSATKKQIKIGAIGVEAKQREDVEEFMLNAVKMAVKMVVP